MNGRKRNRNQLIYSLKVENRDDGSLLGYLMDIDKEGMMIISENPVETSSTQPVRIHLPKNVTRESYFDAVGEVRWCREKDDNTYYIGIRLDEIAEKAEDQVAQLIDRFRQDDSIEEDDSDPFLQNTDTSDIV